MTCGCTGACRVYGSCSPYSPPADARTIGCEARADVLGLLRADDPTYERREGERRRHREVAWGGWWSVPNSVDTRYHARERRAADRRSA